MEEQESYTEALVGFLEYDSLSHQYLLKNELNPMLLHKKATIMLPHLDDSMKLS